VLLYLMSRVILWHRLLNTAVADFEQASSPGRLLPIGSTFSALKPQVRGDLAGVGKKGVKSKRECEFAITAIPETSCTDYNGVRTFRISNSESEGIGHFPPEEISCFMAFAMLDMQSPETFRQGQQ
jgi:hypothetical protein